MKWCKRILLALGIILLIPFLIVALLVLALYLIFLKPFRLIHERRKYKNSCYYKDFQIPYKKNITQKAFYHAYHTFKEKDLDIQYLPQKSSHMESFVYQDTLYHFPDFDGLRYIQDKDTWVVVYRKYSEESMLSLQRFFSIKLENIAPEYTSLPVRIIAERALIEDDSLEGKSIPHELYIVNDYETAFDAATN